MGRPWWVQGREKRSCRGITLPELMFALIILLILAALGTVAYSKYRDNANNARAIADLRAIEHDILIHEGYAGKLPDSLDQVGKGLMLDPWGNPYQYHNTQTGSGNGQQRFDKLGNRLNMDFDLYSLGKNGMTAPGLERLESQDDIVRADNGEFVGMASDF